MRRNSVILWLACLAALLPASLSAQEPPAYTLRVKENLIQIPVLVVSPSGRRIAPPNPNDFTVSLDGGRPMRPSHVRLEGDDPIDLAILLDSDGEVEALLPRFAEALAGLVPASLHPQDSVALYAMGCQLTRISMALPAVPSRIHAQVQVALTRLAAKDHRHCNSANLLQASLAAIIQDLDPFPGRHIILALTSGHPDSSPVSSSRWTNLQHLSNARSTSIFALTQQSILNRQFTPEAHLTLTCQISGGISWSTYPSNLSSTLVSFIGMLRDRSILDFREPGNLPPGHVTLQVRLRHSDALILPAGTSVALPDPAENTDPNLFRPDPSLAPEVGNRHALQPQ